MGVYNKVTFIPYVYIVNISHSPNFETSFVYSSTKASPSSEITPQPDSEPILIPFLHIVQSKAPSTSTHVPPTSSGRPSIDPNPLLQQILDQLSHRTTTSGLTELTCYFETQFYNSIEEVSNSIHNRIDDVVGGVNQLLG